MSSGANNSSKNNDGNSSDSDLVAAVDDNEQRPRSATWLERIHDLMRNVCCRGGNLSNMKMCNKVMLCLSTCDCITSTMYLLGTVPVPKGQAYGSYGTKATCTLQGFLIWYFNATARLYNATLAVCYVCMVRYNATETRLRQFRWIFLLFPHTFGMLVAMPLLIDQSFNYDQLNV